MSAQSEAASIEAWRAKRFLELGANPSLALDLARRPQVDLHEYENLVAAGCAPQLAARILA